MGVVTEVGVDTDRIEKHTMLRAPQSRVWRAITDAREFEAWFGVSLEGTFKEGNRLHGHITIPGYEHLKVEMLVEQIQPESLFSYRWHPYAVDPNVDYSSEPMTLVEFRLAEAEGGVTLTIVESGFDRTPAARRAEAFRMDDHGWTAQIKSIEEYVSQP